MKLPLSTCAFWCLLILGAKLETWSISFSMVLGLMIYICVCWSRSIRSIRSIRSYKSKFHIENTLQRLCDRIEIGIPRPPQVEFIQMQRSARGAQSTAPSRHDMKNVKKPEETIRNLKDCASTKQIQADGLWFYDYDGLSWSFQVQMDHRAMQHNTITKRYIICNICQSKCIL